MSGSPAHSKHKFLPKGLSGEFLRIGTGATHHERLEDALLQCQIRQITQEVLAFQDVTEWHRGGAESYIADSTVLFADGREHHVLAKALVASGPFIDNMLDSWTKRRTLLEMIGVRVPRLYCVREGVFFEEFIDEPFLGDVPLLDSYRNQLASIAAKLDAWGFNTLCFTADLRIKNTNLYYVDFGFDLGDPSAGISNSARTCIERIIGMPRLEQWREYYSKLLDAEISNRNKMGPL